MKEKPLHKRKIGDFMIYTKCRNCGRPKPPNKSMFCSSHCRKEYQENYQRNARKFKDFVESKVKSIFRNPWRSSELVDKLSKECGLDKLLVGKCLNDLTNAGVFRCFPSVRHELRVFYRIGDDERGHSLFKRLFHEWYETLSDEGKGVYSKNLWKHKDYVRKIGMMYPDYSVDQIADILNINKNIVIRCVEEL